LFVSKLLKRKWLLISFAAISIIAICLIIFAYFNRATATLTDINNVEELQALFNQDKGKVRVILLMSPT